MGETDAVQLCRIETCEPLSYDELLVRVCSQLDVDGTIPGAMNHVQTFRLADEKGVHCGAHVRPGQTVHLHSRKGIPGNSVALQQTEAEERSASCFVCIEGNKDLFLEVPQHIRSHASASALRDWACETLGLQRLLYYVAQAEEDGTEYYTLKSMTTPTPRLAGLGDEAPPQYEKYGDPPLPPMPVSGAAWSVPVPKAPDTPSGPYIRVTWNQGSLEIVVPIECGVAGMTEAQLKQAYAQDRGIEDLDSFVLHMATFPLTKPHWSAGDLAVCKMKPRN